jgi:glycosyltransferase involved in cell wall biosynthesis
LEKLQIISGGLRTRGIKKTSSEGSPLVSIITVVFNGEKYLEQTILSVINQTYTNVEYIIIDGLSSDHSLNIINKYNDKIDYWISEADRGMYDALNKGIALSSGDLIGIINSDDWYEDYTIKMVVEAYKNNSRIKIFHGMHRLWESNNLLGIVGHSDLFLKYGMISHPTCFVQKDVYTNLGGFNCKFKISADYELMLRFNSKNIPFLFIEKILANFRNTGISNTSKTKAGLETIEIQKMYSLISGSQHFLARLGYLVRSMIFFKK